MYQEPWDVTFDVVIPLVGSCPKKVLKNIKRDLTKHTVISSG